MNIEQIIRDLCSHEHEEEWFEFKENWFQPDTLGEYISALSNAAALYDKETAYFVWGVSNTTHKIIGTKFNQYRDYKDEPYQNYLARNLSPSLNFKFYDTEIDGKRIVMLAIPAATVVPTAFKGSRYLRIGSSKANMKDYPQREKELFHILNDEHKTIETEDARYQDLSFNKLFGYYGSRGIVLKQNTFVKNLGLRNKDGKYNMLAQLLSDNSHFSLRVSIFTGKTKGSNLFSVREFGNDCLLYTLDELLRYGDVLNLIQTDETDRVVERKEVSLFDNKAFREAIINAVLHNKWVDGNEPMISVFSDRIEILSRGTLPPGQTVEGFYQGESIPVNEKLSEIFLQLHISEKSGRGVPKIVEVYGKDVFSFRKNSIVVTIPFTRIKSQVGNKVGEKVWNKPLLSARRTAILSELRDNPNATAAELSDLIHISATAIEKHIAYLRDNGYIERIGSKKTGYWHIIE